MSIFLNILLGSLLFGVLGGISFSTGVFVYIHDIVVTIGVVYGVILLRTQKKIYIPLLWKPIVLFLLAGIISLLGNTTQFPVTSMLTASLYLVRWLLYACVYVVFIQHQISARTLLTRLFWFGVAFGILGIIQLVLYPDLRFLLYLGWDPHFYRLFSTLLDPNYAGMLLVLTALLGYYLYRTERKALYAILIGVIVVCVYLTYSRSSYLALLTGASVYGMLQKQWKVLIALFGFVACVLLIPRPGGTTLNLLREDSTISRFSNWQQSASLFALSPLFGHGFNTLRYIQTPTETGWATFVSHSAAGVDSSILFLLVTTGIVGCSAYLYLLYRAGLTDSKKKESTASKQLYISSLSALLMHSLFVNSLFYPWVLLWMWMLIASVELTYDR